MSVRSLSLVVVSVLAAALGGASSATAAPGDLDQTFGNGGIAVATLTGRFLSPVATTTQPDGKVIIAGESSASTGTNTFRQFVARLNADGTPDLAFGTAGIAETDYDAATSVDELVNDVAVAPDGRIVTSGEVDSGGDKDSTVTSYLPNGAPDTAFGPALNGKMRVAFGDAGTEDEANRVAVRGDGKILVLGTAYLTSDSDTYVAKYSQTGTPESGFGNGGIRYLNYTGGGIGGNDESADLALLPGGNILAFSECQTTTAQCLGLTRLTALGNRDTEFGDAGDMQFVPDSGFSPIGIVVQSTGKIVLTVLDSPYGMRALGMYRFLSDGSGLDGSFGAGGFTTIAYPGDELVLSATAPAGGDGILAAGRVNASSASVLVRANADGTASSTFGNNGIRVVTQLPHTSFQDVTVSSTGRYVAAGPQA